MRVMTSQYEMWQKSHLLTQNVFVGGIIYPQRQNSLEQAAF